MVTIRRGLAVGLAAASSFFALTVDAGASPDVRYGIQDDAWLLYGEGTLESRIETLDQLGVDIVRFTIDWSAVEARRGTHDWSRVDPVLRGLRARGIRVVATLYGTPRWANGGRSANWAPASGSTFASFAAAAAARYPWVKDWLIWNEPNQRRWLQPTTPSTYVTKLLNPAYWAIHRASAGVRVAGGATAPRASSGGVSPVDWIRGMRAARARLDAYAHHPYPLSRLQTPSSGACVYCATITMASLERLLREVSMAWGGVMRIWLTEYGYQTNPPDPFLGVRTRLKPAMSAKRPGGPSRLATSTC